MSEHDHLSERGAVRLAGRLILFWRDRGFDVEARVSKIATKRLVFQPMYQVRTDLVNGWPQKRRGQVEGKAA